VPYQGDEYRTKCLRRCPSLLSQCFNLIIRDDVRDLERFDPDLSMNSDRHMFSGSEVYVFERADHTALIDTVDLICPWVSPFVP
jgi:hypothetical protein